MICFRDVLDDVLQKKKKQAVSTLCMIEMWLVYRTLKKYFETVVKSMNSELTATKKENFHSYAEFNPHDKKVTHCYLCEYPIDVKVCYRPDFPIASSSHFNFLICREYQFLKNLFSEKEIKESIHLSSLSDYYHAMTFLFRVFEHSSFHADHPINFADPDA